MADEHSAYFHKGSLYCLQDKRENRIKGISALSVFFHPCPPIKLLSCCVAQCWQKGRYENLAPIVIVIVNSKLLKRHSKAKRRAPAYSRALHRLEQRATNRQIHGRPSAAKITANILRLGYCENCSNPIITFEDLSKISGGKTKIFLGQKVVKSDK